MCSKNNGILQESKENTLQESKTNTSQDDKDQDKGYAFTIIITGYSRDRASVRVLRENLESEIWHETWVISNPIIIKIP